MPQARSWSNTIFSIGHGFPVLPPQVSGSSQPTETQILRSRIWLAPTWAAPGLSSPRAFSPFPQVLPTRNWTAPSHSQPHCPTPRVATGEMKQHC